MSSLAFLVAANTADGDVVVDEKIAPLILRLLYLSLGSMGEMSSLQQYGGDPYGQSGRLDIYLSTTTIYLLFHGSCSCSWS